MNGETYLQDRLETHRAIFWLGVVAVFTLQEAASVRSVEQLRDDVATCWHPTPEDQP